MSKNSGLTGPDVELTQAKSKAYAYLSIRARTRREVTGYLQKKKFTPAIVTMVVDNLERLKLVNDQAYAVAGQINHAAVPMSA